MKWIGIPIGFGSTKTLAKLANHVAESADRKPGSYAAEFARVCGLAALSSGKLASVLAETNVGDIWGIGRRLSAQLQSDGLTTALQLAHMDRVVARRRWSVVVERTVREAAGAFLYQP